jgi:WD40 repeat protein
MFDHPVHQGGVEAICFGGDERTLLVGGSDATVRIWNLESGEPIHDFKKQAEKASSAGSSQAGNLLAVGMWSDAPHIRLWRRDTFSDYATLRGHFDGVTGLAIFRDGKTLISSSGDQTVRIWDLSTLRQRFVFDGSPYIFHCLGISPDERTLAAGARDGTIRLYRAASPEEVQAAPGWSRLPEDEATP